MRAEWSQGEVRVELADIGVNAMLAETPVTVCVAGIVFKLTPDQFRDLYVCVEAPMKTAAYVYPQLDRRSPHATHYPSAP